MFCSKCGARLADGAQFCTACGTAVPGAVSQPPVAPPAIPSAVPPAAAPQYMPPAPAYAPPVGPDWTRPRVDYAGFWLRFVALLIDTLIWGIPVVFMIAILAAMMGVAGAFKQIEPGESPGDVISILGAGFVLVAGVLLVIGRWLYYAALESSTWQGTLGKKVLGLYVTDLKGNRITFRRATGRFFSRIVTGLIPFEIGYIMAGFTQKKQALHDMIASCLVLRRV